MARTIYDDDIVLGLRTADGKAVFRKPAQVEAKQEPARDEPAEHRAAMLVQAKAIADLLAQNADLLDAVHSMLAKPARQVDAWEFKIERDDDGLAKTVKATPTKRNLI